MNGVVSFIRTIVSYLVVGLIVLVFGVPLFIVVLVTPYSYRCKNKLIYWLLSVIYNGIIRATFVPLSVSGCTHVPHEPCIFVANHQSALDIPLLGIVIGGRAHVWYIYEVYMRMPVLGFFTRRFGFVVPSANNAQAARSVVQGVRFLKDERCDLAIFPEGGRFNDGTVHEFYRGFAVLARKTGRPVVPVFMPYNGRVYPPFSFFIYAHALVIIVGKPFYLEQDETDEQFVQRIYAWFVEQNKNSA